MYTVELGKLVEKMNLENCTPEIDISSIQITQPDVNRPALQLTGFFDYFDSDRVQIIGNVEHAYMQKMEKALRCHVLFSVEELKFLMILKK